MMKRAAMLVLLLNTAVLAGEAGKGDTGEEKYELLPMGRRDPFTVWKPQVVAPPPVDPVRSSLNIEPELQSRPGRTTRQPRSDQPKTTKDPEIPLSKARSSLESAYHFLFIGEYSAAVASTEEAMRHLEELSLDRAGRLQEKAMRINKAAKKLKFRKEVEAEFRKLPIKIQGIVWKPENAFAVVDGEMVGEGKIVEGARIYEIQPRNVIFVFKGLKVSKELFEGGEGNAPSPKTKSRQRRSR